MRLAAWCRLCVATMFLVTGSCVYNEIPVPNASKACDTTDLAVVLVSSTDATTCHSIDGQIEVVGTKGVPPYTYKIGEGEYQSSPVFENLGPGIYHVRVKDALGCWRSLEVPIGAGNSTLAASVTTVDDTECLGPPNGSITVTPTGGTPPYQVKLDGGAFDPIPGGGFVSYIDRPSGIHTVLIKDDDDCEMTFNPVIKDGDTGVSYAADIAPILNVTCNLSGCHGAGTGSRDWTVFTNVQNKAAQIKVRTGNRSMPIGTGPTLTADEIQLIACWVDDGAKNN